jgi:hypothetical protein
MRRRGNAAPRGIPNGVRAAAGLRQGFGGRGRHARPTKSPGELGKEVYGTGQVFDRALIQRET